MCQVCMCICRLCSCINYHVVYVKSIFIISGCVVVCAKCVGIYDASVSISAGCVGVYIVCRCICKVCRRSCHALRCIAWLECIYASETNSNILRHAYQRVQVAT